MEAQAAGSSRGTQRVTSLDLTGNQNEFTVSNAASKKPKRKANGTATTAGSTQSAANNEAGAGNGGPSQTAPFPGDANGAPALRGLARDPIMRSDMGAGGSMNAVIARIERRCLDAGGISDEDSDGDVDQSSHARSETDLDKGKHESANGGGGTGAGAGAGRGSGDGGNGSSSSRTAAAAAATRRRQKKANKEEQEWLKSGEGFLADEDEENEDDIARREALENALENDGFYVHRGPLLSRARRKSIRREVEERQQKKANRKKATAGRRADAGTRGPRGDLSPEDTEEARKAVASLLNSVRKIYEKVEKDATGQPTPSAVYTRELDLVLVTFVKRTLRNEKSTARKEFMKDIVNRAFRNQTLAEFKKHLKRVGLVANVNTLRNDFKTALVAFADALERRGVTNATSRVRSRVRKKKVKASLQQRQNLAEAGPGAAAAAQTTVAGKPHHPYGLHVWSSVISRQDGLDDAALDNLYFGRLSPADVASATQTPAANAPKSWADLLKCFVDKAEREGETDPSQMLGSASAASEQASQRRRIRAMCKGYLQRCTTSQGGPEFFWDLKTLKLLDQLGIAHKKFYLKSVDIWKHEIALFGKIKTQCRDREAFKTDIRNLWGDKRTVSMAELSTLLALSDVRPVQLAVPPAPGAAVSSSAGAETNAVPNAAAGPSSAAAAAAAATTTTSGPAKASISKALNGSTVPKSPTAADVHLFQQQMTINNTGPKRKTAPSEEGHNPKIKAKKKLRRSQDFPTIDFRESDFGAQGHALSSMHASVGTPTTKPKSQLKPKPTSPRSQTKKTPVKGIEAHHEEGAKSLSRPKKSPATSSAQKASARPPKKTGDFASVTFCEADFQFPR